MKSERINNIHNYLDRNNEKVLSDIFLENGSLSNVFDFYDNCLLTGIITSLVLTRNMKCCTKLMFMEQLRVFKMENTFDALESA